MKRKISLSSVGISIGVLLIAASAVMIVSSLIMQALASGTSATIVADMKDIMPEVYDTVPDDRINLTMPAVLIDGESFCGIIKAPAYGVELPIHEVWNRGKLIYYPCRYMGSIYDGSLVIGGSDIAGQLEFISRIQNGDIIQITDTSGGTYTYAVFDIRRSRDVSTEYLTSIDADLVIFARNSYSFDYTVIRCNFE